MSTANVIAKLRHPREAQVGDLVFRPDHTSPSGVTVAEVLDVTRNGYLKVTGIEQGVRRKSLPPVTKHRIAEYVEGLRLLAMPVVGAYRADWELPIYPVDPQKFDRVVGREECAIAVDRCTRTPSNYVDVRATLTNQGEFTVLLKQYDWHDQQPRDESPFAYMGDSRLRVFSVETREKVWSGQSVDVRVSVSSWATADRMRLFLPSGLFGGAIGTYTALVVDVPEPIDEVIQLTETDIVS